MKAWPDNLLGGATAVVEPIQQTGGDPIEWYREQQRRRGALLRMLLERGVSWRELEGVLPQFRAMKRESRLIVERWPVGFKWKVKPKETRTQSEQENRK